MEEIAPVVCADLSACCRGEHSYEAPSLKWMMSPGGLVIVNCLQPTI